MEALPLTMSCLSKQPALGLAALVNELFDMILEHLSFGDRAALAASSTLLMHRMEPRLLSTPQQRDKVLIHASRKGYSSLVRRAVSLGANPRAPLIPNTQGSAYGHRLNPVFALRLAVKSGDMAAFQQLVERGASVDAYVDEAERCTARRLHIDAEIDALLWLLSRPDRLQLLRRFCADDTLPPLRAEHLQTCLQYTIERSVRKGVWPKDAVQLLISHGASIRALQSSTLRGKCPVATAILRGHADMAEEMLRLGASVHGKQPRPTESIQLEHLPMFAAARRMAIDGPSIVRRLLVKGADPYQQAELQLYQRRANDSGHWLKERIRLQTPFPIHVYLASIRWGDETFCPLEGLRFWKSLSPVPFSRDTVVLPVGTERRVWTYWGLGPLLLEQWGPNRLVHESFYLVLKDLDMEMRPWDLRIAQGNVFGYPSAFKCPEGLAAERWESLFKLKFPTRHGEY